MKRLMEEKRLEMAKQMELQLVENREPLLSQNNFNGKSNGYRTPRTSRHHREVGNHSLTLLPLYCQHLREK